MHQVLEQIIILQSSQYSVSVHTYCVDGQLPSIKEIPQVTEKKLHCHDARGLWLSV